jgi:predicted DCC family thiol-disulfide oxidoreductase YuxK
LMQVQLTIAYFHAFITKMEGDRWQNGTAVYFASRYDDIMRFPLPILLDNLFIINALTFGTLVVEFALATFIWWRPARYWVMLFGLGLHAGIEYTMNLPMFQWLFMTSYFLFIYPEDLTKVMDKINSFIHKNIAKPGDLIFDGNCILCVRTVGLIHRLDIFRLVRLHDLRNLNGYEHSGEIDRNQAEKEILLRTPDGKWLAGFKAFRWMTLRLPMLALLFPLLHVPGIAQLGEAVYQYVAARRYVILGSRCEHDVCAVAK